MDSAVLEFLNNKENYYFQNSKDIDIKEVGEFLPTNLILYKLEDMMFFEDSSRRKIIEDILCSIRIEGINFIYLILGNKEGVNYYFGISKDLHSDIELSFEVEEIGSNILKPNIKGNFKDGIIKDVNSEEKSSIYKTINNMNLFFTLTGAVGKNDGDEKLKYIDKLVNYMDNEEYGFMVIAKPLTDQCIINIERNLNMLYEEIWSIANTSTTESNAKVSGNDFGKTIGEAVTNAYNTSVANWNSFSETKGGSSGTSITKINGTSETAQRNGNNISRTNSRSETVQNNTRNQVRTSGRSEASQNNRGSLNESITTSEGKQENEDFGENWSSTTVVTDINTGGYTRSNTTNISTTEVNRSRERKETSTTVQNVNKEASSWIEYMDEVLFKRLDYGKGSGLFSISTLLFAKDDFVLKRLENVIKLFFVGNGGNKVLVQTMNLNSDDVITNNYKKFQMPLGTFLKEGDVDNTLARCAFSQCFDEKGNLMFGNWISLKELSLIVGIPKKKLLLPKWDEK